MPQRQGLVKLARSSHYIVTEAQLYKMFGDTRTSAFVIYPTEGGRTYFLPITGEYFTVMDDSENVLKTVEDHLNRAQTLKKKKD